MKLEFGIGVHFAYICEATTLSDRPAPNQRMAGFLPTWAKTTQIKAF